MSVGPAVTEEEIPHKSAVLEAPASAGAAVAAAAPAAAGAAASAAGVCCCVASCACRYAATHRSQQPHRRLPRAKATILSDSSQTNNSDA